MQTIDQLRSGALSGARHLRLSCGLTSFPPEILDLADTLEILDLSGNALSDLPDDFARLRELRIAFFSDNEFTSLPETLGCCPKLTMVGFKANRIRHIQPGALPKGLRWLVLTGNEIEELPPEIGACTQLQKLMLAGNRLGALPASLANCHRLELLRIAANRFEELPTWLLKMPRLSWLAYSGNPVSARSEIDALSSASIENVSWDSLEIDRLLGEGASGVIHLARMNGNSGESRIVAVKMFKGTITSDGFPRSEMAASIGAGKHPSMISVFGKVVDHPSGSNGLVMRLVDPEMKNLAGPPSLDSCTRDIYPSSAAFDLPALLRILHSVASAARHLHDRGIMHGDLYGHNILHGLDGQTLIGDFGAASFYEADKGAVAQGLQRLEVRAFGCLMEELMDRCRVSRDEARRLALLEELKSACLSEQIELRPLFDAIDLSLQSIQSLDWACEA